MTQTQALPVAIVQHACGPDDAANLKTSLDGVARAAAEGARLVLLPELHKSQYFCRTENPDLFDLADPIPGPTTEQIGQAAREHGVVIVASLFERRAVGL
jgi:N-carbamoylputrescine amidase